MDKKELLSEIETCVKWVCNCGTDNRFNLTQADSYTSYFHNCICGKRYEIKTYDLYENYVEIFLII